MIQGKGDRNNVVGNLMHIFLVAQYVDHIMINATWII